MLRPLLNAGLEKELKRKIAAFSPLDFGGEEVTADLAAASEKNYPKPPVDPTRGRHPRVLFTAADLPGIRAALTDPRNAVAVELFREAVAHPTDGDFGIAEQRGDKFYNFNQDVLIDLQALALNYASNGDRLSGLRAIYALKNALKTMDFRDIGGDQCRQFGFVAFTAACVYDWCYDLLTDRDKKQIVAGVEHKVLSGENDRGAKMEVGFPPSGQGAVSGHGTEFQFLRDYLAFAIAIYDEYPLWWDYIGGRFFAEYVPVRNEFYRAGMYPQGTSLYIQIRFAADLYSALLARAATGSIPYDEADMKRVLRTAYSYELPGGCAFASGDDHTGDAPLVNLGQLALLSSYLFNDATVRAQLEYHEKSYSDFNGYFTSCASSSLYLICSSSELKPAPDRHADMPLVLYNGGWLGQLIARNDWGEKQAAVLAKIGVRSTANHEHNDAGQFQIFYRAMLAGDTGSYDKYGDPHHYWYHQATVAHNGLLIYNPALAGSDRGYYSGGQTHKWECHDFAVWQNDREHKTGTVTGLAAGYADETKTKPTYAYIAGDITPAYDGSTVSEVTRRMLTVFDTGNTDVPMILFVFDRITANDPAFKKTFLLHVPAEPKLDGRTVSVERGEGKLVLQSVFGCDLIEKIGGTGKNYVVNGEQLAPCKGGDDGFWGRVEISPTPGRATDDLLNVIFVTDSDKSPVLKAQKIATDEVKGAILGKVAALFVCDAKRREDGFSFTLPGDRESTVYVSGVAAGEWTVATNGFTRAVTASAEGGLLVFNSLPGEVTLAKTLR